MEKKPFYKSFTIMMDRYLLKFSVRLAIFAAVLIVYILRKDILVSFMTHKFMFGVKAYGFSLLHLLWCVLIVMMLRHLKPMSILTMALKKSEKKYYLEYADYSREGLFGFVQYMNYKAWIVLFVWVCFNSIFGVLYLLGIIDTADLLLLTMFYFLSDYICILFFCPFQTFIMKNRCCINCRIYDWGHFMMFTPMLFIRSFFSWSLFFLSLVVLIRWEMTYAKYPERFWYGSNKTLQCGNCKDKTCQIKKKIVGDRVKYV